MKQYSAKAGDAKARMTMGLELGDKRSFYLTIDHNGEWVEEGRIRSAPQTFRRLLKKYEPMRVVIEAGGHSGWAAEVIQECGHEAVVANPRKLRLVYRNRRKTDRADAEYLARLGRVDVHLLAPIRHRGAQARRDLQLLRSRDRLVAVRSQLIHHVRSSVKSEGARLPACSSETFDRCAQAHIPAALSLALEPLLRQIGSLTSQIRGYDRQIAQWSRQRYPECEALMQIQGVGPLTALAFVLTLQDAARFPNSRSVGPYLGLCPGKNQSGERDFKQRITREGNKYLRWLLVQCAHYIMGPFGQDSDLRRYGQKLTAAGKQKGEATVAVARKLSVLMHRLWSDGIDYEPLRQAERKQARSDKGSFSCGSSIRSEARPVQGHASPEAGPWTERPSDLEKDRI